MQPRIKNMLDKEFKYYLDHQKELLKTYNGKYIVIVGNEVIGGFGSTLEAYTEVIKKHKAGTFLIQFCSPGKGSYTHTFHTHRVSFSSK